MNEKENDSYTENITVEKEVYTSEWLKENTSIHGWLYVFFIVTIAGGLISAMEIFTINPEEYAYNNCLIATDILFGIFALGLSVYTVYLFISRKPNAIFYGRISNKLIMWLWIIIIAIVIGAISGFLSTRHGESVGENTFTGAMAGGCLAVGCLWRILLFGASILLVLWLLFKLFG